MSSQVVFIDGIEVPLMVQKSDGGYGYGTTDMAAIRHRIQEEHGDFIVYVTDLGQAPHFQQVFGAARKAGFIPKDNSVRIEHVGFGVVLNEDGQRIKSRSGDVSSPSIAVSQVFGLLSRSTQAMVLQRNFSCTCKVGCLYFSLGSSACLVNIQSQDCL